MLKTAGVERLARGHPAETIARCPVLGLVAAPMQIIRERIRPPPTTHILPCSATPTARPGHRSVAPVVGPRLLPVPAPPHRTAESPDQSRSVERPARHSSSNQAASGRGAANRTG